MMLGARNARMAVSLFLADAMPPRLADYRTTWGYTTTDLPDPRKYFSYEPVAVDKWPSIITVVMGMGRLAVDDYADASEPEYGVIYQMRTYVWSRGVGPVQATNIRDDLTTVVRDLLIDNPRLQNVNHSNSYDCGYRVDDTSVREEYSDLTLLKGERVACASFVAYDLRAQESPTRAALGTVGVDGISLSVGLLNVPNAPTGVTVVVDDPTGNDTDVTVSWTEPTWDGIEDGLTQYTIQQTSDGGASWSTLASIPATGTSYAVTGLKDGTYQWRVAALTAKGPGPYSLPSSAVVVLAFSPLDLSPALWLDASDTNTITESTPGSGDVSQWDDKSGNGYNLAQGTSTAQPATGTRTINSLNVIDFDGTNHFMTTASEVRLSQPNHVFLAMRTDNIVNGKYVFDNYIGAASGSWFQIFASQYYANSGSGVLGGTTVTSPILVHITYNVASSSIRVDGVEIATGNIGTNDLSLWTLGKRDDGAVPFDGALGEIIIVNGTLSAQQISDTETYLADKWGITL